MTLCTSLAHHVPPLLSARCVQEHVAKICKRLRCDKKAAYPESDERQHGFLAAHHLPAGSVNHALHLAFKESGDGL